MKKTPTPAPDATLARSLRRYLYFTAATTGAAILIVEILGAKMLSPYVGTSHFVWTAQIAVTLVSLACGYWFGGWLVDRSHKLGRLYGCILLAAVYLAATVPAVEPVAYWCLGFKLAVGALLASAFLFFVPLTLLATTGPFLVRVLTQSVVGVGGQVGRLSAISTFGSVFGTVLIGYVLIPFFPNSVTMFSTAAALLVLAAVYFFSWGRQSHDQVGVTVAIAVGLLAGYAGVVKDRRTEFSGGEQVFRGNSNFGQLQVLQSKLGDRLYYLNDYLTQNGYDPDHQKSINMFTYMLHDLARAYAPRVEDVLCIGMGVGIVPMQFAREGARVEVVEINPAVVPVAEKFFHFEASRVRLVIGDGRQFLNHGAGKYDAVILDAFLGDSSPSHLMTREAFAAMGRVLKPGGVLVINSFADFDAGKDFFAASLHKTLKAAFKSVLIHADGRGNTFFVASDTPPLTILHPPDLALIHPTCRERVAEAFQTLQETNPQHGIVLTDDFNPVEFHDAANRESLRRNLAFGMRAK